MTKSYLEKKPIYWLCFFVLVKSNRNKIYEKFKKWPNNLLIYTTYVLSKSILSSDLIFGFFLCCVRFSTFDHANVRNKVIQGSTIIFILWINFLQKQPSRDVLRKMCFENMQQIYRRTHMAKGDFNKVTVKLYWKRTSAWVLQLYWHTFSGCVFSCKFAAYFQGTFSTEHRWMATSK